MHWGDEEPAPPKRVAGFELRVDPRVPPDEVHFEQGGIVVGRIVGVHCPTWYERLWAWLTRPRRLRIRW